MNPIEFIASHLILLAGMVMVVVSLKRAIRAQGARTMETIEQRYNAVIEKLDAATNRIGAELRDLANQVRSGGLTAEQEDAFATQLEAKAAALDLLGRDPADPVPTPAPEAPAPEAAPAE
jgi:hypothetical protein